MSKKKSGMKHFALGALVGAGLGVLFAPRSGKDTREALKKKMNDLLEKVKELDKEDVKGAIELKIENIKEAISNLDKETVLEAAKKQCRKVRDLAEELVDYVVDKGTPVLESAASAVRCKAIDVTKEVLNKLESKQNNK